MALARVFTTSQSAEAHFRLFKELFRIVEEDTGLPVLFRHLHSLTLDTHVGLELVGADQHLGQAKGMSV